MGEVPALSLSDIEAIVGQRQVPEENPHVFHLEFLDLL